MWLMGILYLPVLAFVRICKWIELLFLYLFYPLVVRLAIKYCAEAGIVFHFPSDPQWTMDDEEKAIAKMTKKGNKFGSLVHIKSNKPRSSLIRCVNRGPIQYSEYYMDGTWEFTSTEQITECLRRMLLVMPHCYYHRWNRFLYYLEFIMFNMQAKSRVKQSMPHYNLGNELFESFLGKYMQYTGAYWAKADNLDSAQWDKMELIAKKLDLKPGMRVLDIGCGWGMLCKHLAENYGVSCVGVTISSEGVKYGQKICEGLPVDIRLQDYREVKGKFDRVVSIGMFEHVGPKNHREFFKIASRCLIDDGIFLLHTMGVNHPPSLMAQTDDFNHTYVFPNAIIPLTTNIADSSFGLFILEDWHNFSLDYYKTLVAWQENFQKNWPTISAKYDEKFYRMWSFYLAAGAALFQSRRLQLWQLVLSKDGLKREYRAAR